MPLPLIPILNDSISNMVESLFRFESTTISQEEAIFLVFFAVSVIVLMYIALSMSNDKWL